MTDNTDALPSPYAWSVYFPDERRIELVHELDDLLEDLTNCAHDEPVRLYTEGDLRAALASRDAELAKLRQGEPVVWLVHTKDRRFVRACWTVPPTKDQLEAAAYDGDIITPCCPCASPPPAQPPQAEPPVKRLRALAEGVRIGHAPDTDLLAQRMENIADAIERLITERATGEKE
jgi:hypothetical protein